jgi:hypothetical protein
MIHKHFVDNMNDRSVATRLRRQRFQLFLDMLGDVEGIVSILDVGGNQKYWEMMTAGLPMTQELHVTLLNVEPSSVSLPNFTAIMGDGRSMPQFGDGQFDIVFSNSTIEHVGDFNDQQQMANEVRRIGRMYYIQTPNLYFPVEPHFVFPFFQFLPVKMRAWLLQRFNLGWYRKIPDYRKALNEVSSIRLLNRNELKQLFPEATIFDEKFYGLVKSFVAILSTRS